MIKNKIYMACFFLPACFMWAFFLSPSAPAGGTELELVREGRPAADIVSGPEPSPVMESAARLLAAAVEKTSGVKLPVAAAAGNASAHIILDDKAPAGSLDAGGFEIVFPAVATVRIRACSAKGVLCGVYAFIENHLKAQWLPLNSTDAFARSSTVAVPRNPLRAGPADLARRMWEVDSPPLEQIELARAKRPAYMWKGWMLLGLAADQPAGLETEAVSGNPQDWLIADREIANYDSNASERRNVEWIREKTGLAAQFNGSNSFMLVHDFSFDFPSPMTVECWIKPARVNGYIMGCDPYFFIRLNPRINAGVNQNGWREVASSAQAVTGEWSHVCLTYDLNELCLFINGVKESSGFAPAMRVGNKQPDQTGRICRQILKATLTPAERLIPVSGFLAFGCTPWKIDEAGGFFNGLIAGARIYARKLTLAEIQSSFEKGAALCPAAKQAK